MATWQCLADDIKKTFGSSMISQKQLGEWLGFSKDACGAFAAAIPFYPTPKKKLYHCNDVAKHLDKIRTYQPYG